MKFGRKWCLKHVDLKKCGHRSFCSSTPLRSKPPNVLLYGPGQSALSAKRAVACLEACLAQEVKFFGWAVTGLAMHQRTMPRTPVVRPFYRKRDHRRRNACWDPNPGNGLAFAQFDESFQPLIQVDVQEKIHTVALGNGCSAANRNLVVCMVGNACAKCFH